MTPAAPNPRLLRVLHVLKGLGPGGAERFVVSLCAARAADVDAEVAYLLPHKAHLVPELGASGVGARLVGGRRGLADPRWIARLRRLVVETRPDIVHVHSPAVAPVVRMLVRSCRPRPRVVSIEQNVWGSYGWLTRVANQLTIPLSDLHLAVSEEVRASMGPRTADAVVVLENAIPYAAVAARRAERTRARSRLGVDEGTLAVVTVANFRHKKDLPTLLAAAAACAREPALRFFLIGQGPLEAAVRERHRALGLGERFEILGYHPDPPALVAGADIFTLTSLHEGLPIALLEAMALGVAPVVSSVGGVPEVLTDGINGILVAPGDSAAFADAYCALARDPARRRALGEAARARAADFDIRRTQAELELRYRALLAPG